MRIRGLTKDIVRQWKVALAVAAGAVVLATGVMLGFIELGVFDYGAKRWTTIVLASLGVSAGLTAVAVKDEPAKGICAVFAFIVTGTALVVST